MSNEFEIYKGNKYIGKVHVFQDECGTELNSVHIQDGEEYHVPLSPFCYISEEQLSMEDVSQFIEYYKEEIIKALEDIEKEDENVFNS